LRRFPAVAGSFYEADPAKLRKQIEWSFLHPVGPGKIPEVPFPRERGATFSSFPPTPVTSIAARWPRTLITT